MRELCKYFQKLYNTFQLKSNNLCTMKRCFSELNLLLILLKKKLQTLFADFLKFGEHSYYQIFGFKLLNLYAIPVTSPF